jgi:very-short-patch-repair endonuclease
MTEAERILWSHLRQEPFAAFHFRRQATIGPFFADFASHQHRLVIEVDGGYHNEGPHAAADHQRTAFLEASGYRMVRFWNSDVLTNVEGVLIAIKQALTEQLPPPLTPPHRKRGEGNTARQMQCAAQKIAAAFDLPPPMEGEHA